MAEDLVTVITGGSKGIGRATAEHLAGAGHHVIGIARNAPDDGFPGEFMAVDLADRQATADAVTEIATRYQVTGLLNNVGMVKPDPLGQIDLDTMMATLDLSLRTSVQFMEAFLPAMKARQYGRVVNISSLTILGMPERTSYAATKAAIVSFTRTWALETAAHGICINAVAPGPVESELFRQNNPPGSPGRERYEKMCPNGRIGQPDECGAVIAFLLSPAASLITGQTIHVDGGASIGNAAF